MIRKLFALSRDDFIQDNTVFFAGSLLVALLNYLYYPVLGRMMTVQDFGDVQVLIALFSQLSIVNIIFGMVALNIRANDGADAGSSLRNLSAIMFCVSAAIGLVIVAAASLLMRFFQLHSLSALLLLALCLPASTACALGNAHMQATKSFSRLTVSNVLASGGKLAAAAVLVGLGFATMGAIAALLLANILAYAYIVVQAGSPVTLSAVSRMRWTPELRSEAGFAFLVVCAAGSVVFLVNGDVTVVKYLFPPDVAGYYGGVSTVGRIIFLLTASVSGVLLSHVRLNETAGEHHAVVMKSLFLVALVGGGSCAALMAAPERITALLLGATYLPLAPLLPLMALQFLALAFVNVFVMYFIAVRRASVIGVCLPGVAATFISLGFLHASPVHIVYSFLVGSAVTLGALAATYAYSLRRSLRS